MGYENSDRTRALGARIAASDRSVVLDGGVGSETGHFERPEYVFGEEMTPDAYAAAALRWRELGVAIIGGCCGTGAEHIGAIASALAA